jgi:hypothetical protein
MINLQNIISGKQNDAMTFGSTSSPTNATDRVKIKFSLDYQFIRIGYPLGIVRKGISTTKLGYEIEQSNRHYILDQKSFEVWSNIDKIHKKEDIQTIIKLLEKKLIIAFKDSLDLLNQLASRLPLRLGFVLNDDNSFIISYKSETIPVDIVQYRIWNKANGKVTTKDIFSDYIKNCNLSIAQNDLSVNFAEAVLYVVENNLIIIR